jgi:hypothetical protein
VALAGTLGNRPRLISTIDAEQLTYPGVTDAGGWEHPLHEGRASHHKQREHQLAEHLGRFDDLTLEDGLADELFY